MRRLAVRSLAATCTVLVALAVSAREAHADGAFPSSFAVFLPQDRQHQMILATNFGLVISNDDGASWRLICEPAILPTAYMYQVGAPPVDALYAEVFSDLARSTDGCAWEAASIQPFSFIDVFADPVVPDHLLAIVKTASTSYGLIESTDGGAHFSPPVLEVSLPEALLGVEIARTEPRSIYVTVGLSDPKRTRILRSDDGLRSFLAFEPPADVLGSTPFLRIIAVDQDDSRRVYFRGVGLPTDGLFITRDGGQTIAQVLRVDSGASAFLRMSNGTILVGRAAGTDGYISIDGGDTFTLWEAGVHISSLAERGGTLYAATSDLDDGFAIAASNDVGVTWRPVLAFRDITQIIDGCPRVQSVCSAAWDAGVRPDATAATDSGPREDAGALTKAEPEKRCSCRTSAAGSADSHILALALVVCLRARSPRRRPTRGRSW